MATDKNRQRSCKQRIRSEYAHEMKQLRQIMKLRQSDDDEKRERGLEEFDSHGLSFDYVAPHTFTDQKRGYFRWQLSWGGPSDEFRFFDAERSGRPSEIEYWFMDWFDGASKTLRGKDFDLLASIFMNDFWDTETARVKYEEAMADYEPPEDEQEEEHY